MAEKKKIIINVGRQFGSGGHLVAEELGRKLGIPVYDNELIIKAAEDSGFSKDILTQSDENRSMFNFSSFFALSKYGPSENYIDDNSLFKIQSDVIRQIAQKGSAVFVGRCSDYILRDMDCCLDVFISAPLEDRKARVSERNGISLEKAEDLCRKKDRTRETYYNYFTFQNWGVASNYDLCINSSILGIEGTADMIINFAEKEGRL